MHPAPTTSRLHPRINHACRSSAPAPTRIRHHLAHSPVRTYHRTPSASADAPLPTACTSPYTTCAFRRLRRRTPQNNSSHTDTPTTNNIHLRLCTRSLRTVRNNALHFLHSSTPTPQLSSLSLSRPPHPTTTIPRSSPPLPVHSSSLSPDMPPLPALKSPPNHHLRLTTRKTKQIPGDIGSQHTRNTLVRARPD